ncbi:MAG: Gfo/Idh/MocA family oxidoreductase, partial [Phycisphaerales bacterium]|nr:Gfo/Idh/MocA family oxidoreductase [Phycisphaerales bacterium]
HHELLYSGTCDAILVAVPHYDHVPIALDAFTKNVHVLLEKPIAVSVKAASEVIEVYKKYPHLKFGIMLNQRNNVTYQKMREMIASGELSEISRITWICTNWFRSNAYYASGGWRATWKGEGGGILINQCPHYLDLVQWIPNMMPNRVTAVASIGKTHPIEVEDEVNAIMEYPNGATGHFVTSTGECPGSNRLEIVGSRGTLICDNGGKLTFRRNRVDAQEFNRTTTTSFGIPEVWNIEIPTTSRATLGEHNQTTQNFVNVILKNEPNEKLLSPGPDGFNGLHLGNAMLMAGLMRKPVDLPVDGDKFDAFIEDLAQKYGGKKTLEAKTSQVNMGASW